MTYPPPADPYSTRASLLLQLRADRPQREVAWEEFYRAYAPIIAGFARKLGALPQDIGDVVQDVMAGFFAASPQFIYNPQRGRFRGYLKTCTWRVFQRRFGNQLKFSGLPIDEIDPQDQRIEQSWNELWEAEQLHRALDMVRQEYQSRPDRAKTFKAFEMYALLGRSAQEAADELEMSVDSVHQAKSRVSRALRTVMEQLDQDEG